MKDMRTKMLFMTLLICTVAFGQKKKVYNNVDTVNQYEDAQIIIYKGGRDTIYYKKQKWDVVINLAKVVNIYDTKLKRKP